MGGTIFKVVALAMTAFRDQDAAGGASESDTEDILDRDTRAAVIPWLSASRRALVIWVFSLPKEVSCVSK